jgi:hypothetical protein
VTSGLGDDTFNVEATTGTLYLYGDGGNNTFNLGSLAPLTGGVVSGIAGALYITGGSNQLRLMTLASPGTNTINVDDTGDTANSIGLLTSSTLTGLGMGVGVTFVSINVMNINLGSGSDTFNVRSTNATTITNLNSGAGVNTVNVGSLASAAGGTLNNIQGTLNVTGNGSDTLNVDDTGVTTAMSGTLTATSLTGLGLGVGGINYSGLAALNVSLGSYGNTFTISDTASATVTTLNSGSGADTVNVVMDGGVTNINALGGNDTVNVQGTGATTNVNTGAGVNTINVGSLAPATGGTLNNIQGTVNITGYGSDTLNVDDTASAAVKTGTLTATSLTGLGMGAGGITYSGLAGLNISLGSGGNTFTINGTYVSTVTTLNSGSGADTVNVVMDGGVTNINAQGGNDTVNVQGTGATTNVNTGTGVNTVNVGSLAPGTGGVVTTIQGTLNVTGNGSDTLNVDDTGVTIATTATLTATSLTGLGMGANGINYSGLATLNINLGSGNDTFTVASVTTATATTVNGDGGTNTAIFNVNGNYTGNLTLINFASNSVYINGDLSGQLTLTGTTTTVTITGSITSTGVLNASAITTMTVGGDLAGLLNVSGLLNILTVNGGTPGKIVAGSVNVIRVANGYGNKVFQVIEGGIERDILATPVAGGTMPGTVHFAFVYDSQSATDPQVAIRVTDANPVARSYNLDLAVVNSSSAQFDLTRIDATTTTGLSNISLQGDLLMTLTAPELQFFTNLTSANPGGIVLPLDSITGVEVSGRLPVGYINVAGIEGLAFGSLITAAGATITTGALLGSTSTIQVLWNLLGSKATLNPATDALVLPFNENQSVKLFAHIDTNPDMVLVMTLTDGLADNLPVTASVQLVPTTNNNVNPLVQSIAFAGNGGSVNSAFSIANITTTGSLGDVTITASAGSTVNNAAGLGNVTAASFFGNINVTAAGIYGVIQTTSGDLGQVITSNGLVTGVTSIVSNGALTGQIISRGNLVSSIKTNSSFTGVIAAQGDIGAIQRNVGGSAVLSGSALIRFGGISVSGANSGQIIALGNIFGDVTVSGAMTGRIAAQGQVVAGLAAGRLGILGNITALSFQAGSAIVSGGLIGDVTGGTSASLGSSAAGFVAAIGAINLKSTTISPANLLPNQVSANLTAINAIFTNGGSPLLFDTGGSLAGLSLIKTDLNSLRDNTGVLSGPIP